MRSRKDNGKISIHAIAGTETVLLGLNASPEAARGLLGFALYKRQGQADQEFKPLVTGHGFEGYSEHPNILQAFLWGDYVVNPNTPYTYRAVPLYGEPPQIEAGESVEVSVSTEDPEHETHGVYFNRGVAGSQAYSKYFGKYCRWYKDHPQEEDPKKITFTEFLKPEDVPERRAYRWLSRGLEEAMLQFIGQAKGPEYKLRAAVYEFTHLPAIQAFVAALESGADVKIVHHAKRQTSKILHRNLNADTITSFDDPAKKPLTIKNSEVIEVESGDSVCLAANAAVGQVGVSDPKHLPAFRQMLIPRKITQISHNKFIVLLKNDQPIQVWTGSTNYTAGGIFGQSNVGHIVRDPAVAEKYYQYWQKLATDPKAKSLASEPEETGMRNWTVLQQPDLAGEPPANSVTVIFSPRLTDAMLAWYADRLDAANNAVFFTAAFSVADEIFDKVKVEKPVGSGEPYLRYLLLEGIDGLLRPKYPVMAECPQNRIAWGETLKQGAGGEDKHQQFIETLTGLNDHVNYLHTKYLLIDPLSDDPIVISGSANFSTASTISNDENMLIMRGNTRVADIYLGEFMRLFNHFHIRNVLNQLTAKQRQALSQLKPDDSWTEPYYDATQQEYQERNLFS